MSGQPHTVIRLLSYVLGLLSIAAAVPKILQMPQELGFLSSLGIGGAAVVGLGLLQLVGGVWLMVPKLRLFGAFIADLMFTVSSAALFVSGNLAFGLVSLLPVVGVMIVIVGLLQSQRLRTTP